MSLENLPPMPIQSVHDCKGQCCFMQSTNPEKDGWRDGYCLDCVTESDAADMRAERELTREELWEMGKEEAADAEIRRDKEDRP